MCVWEFRIRKRMWIISNNRSDLSIFAMDWKSGRNSGKREKLSSAFGNDTQLWYTSSQTHSHPQISLFIFLPKIIINFDFAASKKNEQIIYCILSLLPFASLCFDYYFARNQFSEADLGRLLAKIDFDAEKMKSNLWFISLERIQSGQLPEKKSKIISIVSSRWTRKSKRGNVRDGKNQFSILNSLFLLGSICNRLHIICLKIMRKTSNARGKNDLTSQSQSQS